MEENDAKREMASRDEVSPWVGGDWPFYAWHSFFHVHDVVCIVSHPYTSHRSWVTQIKAVSKLWATQISAVGAGSPLWANLCGPLLTNRLDWGDPTSVGGKGM